MPRSRSSCSLYVPKLTHRNPPPISTHPLLSEDAIAERAERHVRLCQRMAEMGMELAEVAAQRAKQDIAAQCATPEPPAPQTPDSQTPKTPDHGLLFARFTRCVRQAIALEARIIENLQDADRAQRAIPPDPRRRALRRAFHELTANHPNATQIRLEAAERADEAVEADSLGALPTTDLFHAIAADLGINLEETGLPPEISRRMPGPILVAKARLAAQAASPPRPASPKTPLFADPDQDPPGAWWSNHLPQPVRDG